ncbi:MAG: hypothetical protein ACX93T_01210 [Bacteroidota bacterium]
MKYLTLIKYPAIKKLASAAFFIVLLLNLVSCRQSGMGFHQNDTGPAALKEMLNNVPRIFEIDQLCKLQGIPEVPEREGQVIGMILKDRHIVCVDEALLKNILHPLITEHVEKTMSGHANFEIGHSRLLLSRNGEMTLAVDFVVGDQTHTGYLPTLLNNASEATWPQYILLPPLQSLFRCVKSGNTCPSHGSCIWIPNVGCECIAANHNGDGCVKKFAL